MKEKRQAEIVKIISEQSVETQEQLLMHLREHGFHTTQATISRDIKELRLIKVLSEHGTYKYASADRAEKNVSDRMVRLFSESVVTEAPASFSRLSLSVRSVISISSLATLS